MGALQPDLIAGRAGPEALVEVYTDQNPCTPHSHTRTIEVQVTGRYLSLAPTPVAALQRNGQQIGSWQSVAGSQPMVLGRFSWTFMHNCPGGTTTISQPPPPNVRLVVDPAGQLAEASEANNVVEFYVPAEATWTRNP